MHEDIKSSCGLLEDSLFHISMWQTISKNTKLHAERLNSFKSQQVLLLQPTLTHETVIPNSFSVAMTHLDIKNHDKIHSLHFHISHSNEHVLLQAPMSWNK
jgi:hypothetical protein